ncbi:dihydrofolate reductase family protein [Gaiella sp.]|uniref:dihydrofolate reductase family protein n=1 Tax=Gaiella sp. TaxID=2663207 RepID=UPI003982FA92
MRPRLSVFIATSLDGYIAASDGGLEWLRNAATPGDDYGYAAFMQNVDALAMGRGTYDHIAALDPLPFDGRPLCVFTHRPPEPRTGVTFWQATPGEAASEWERQGLGRVYVDGGRLIGSFLEADLIDDITITVVPILLGSGLPLFHPSSTVRRFRLDECESWPDGLVTLSYSRA